MSIIPWQVTAALGIGLICAGGYIYILRADVKVLEAQVVPLQQAAHDAAGIIDAHRTALQTCEDDKKAMRDANAKAVAEAEAARLAAVAQAEEYQRRLANPPADCQAVLSQNICPALADY